MRFSGSGIGVWGWVQRLGLFRPLVLPPPTMGYSPNEGIWDPESEGTNLMMGKNLQALISGFNLSVHVKG